MILFLLKSKIKSLRRSTKIGLLTHQTGSSKQNPCARSSKLAWENSPPIDDLLSSGLDTFSSNLARE